MFFVYSDESGESGANYEDSAQPVLCQTAVLIQENQILNIENETKELLNKYGLSNELEIHANPCLLGTDEYQVLSKEQRHLFLKEYIEIGIKYVFKIHYMGMLKSFVKQFIRENAKKAGLDPFMISFLYLIIIIDKYFEFIIKEKYKYFFDTTNKYRKKIAYSIRLLQYIPQDSLKIKYMIGLPVEIDSKKSRIIQLCDVIGYYLNRHRQLEIKTFRHRESLDRHKEKIFDIYEIIKPKLVNFINNILPQKIDWRALQEFDFIKL
ncbi:MAG: DUF3800 domain-containing protein [bacterium]|nr:DUF3800 domain-containing protein [bacterium]